MFTRDKVHLEYGYVEIPEAFIRSIAVDKPAYMFLREVLKYTHERGICEVKYIQLGDGVFDCTRVYGYINPCFNQ